MPTQKPKRYGMLIKDRDEYNTKPRALTFAADAKVFDAVDAMSEKITAPLSLSMTRTKSSAW